MLMDDPPVFGVFRDKPAVLAGLSGKNRQHNLVFSRSTDQSVSDPARARPSTRRPVAPGTPIAFDASLDRSTGGTNGFSRALADPLV